MKISNISLAIGIPNSFPFVPSEFFRSFAMMEKPGYTLIMKTNGPIDTLRNDIVEKAMAEGCTHILMCDVDQIYDPQTIPKLMSHRLPVVAAKINRRYPPFDPIIMKITDEGYQPIDDYTPGSLVECDATGTGCILYNMEVFRKLPYPWFRFQKNPENGMVIGEDIGFCQDLKAAGYKIYVDTSVEIGHLATIIVNDSMNKLYQAMTLAKEQKAAALGFVK
ncbi:MAG: hypothetical protein ABFD12_01025 [Syntrophorhabdus sp.]